MANAATPSTDFRYHPFGILRFTLACLVMLQHFCSDIAPQQLKQIIYPFAPGNVAVLAFFILSGFMICEAYWHHYQTRPFAYLKNRFLRIFPGYWAALFLSILVHLYFVLAHGSVISLDGNTLDAAYFNAENLARNIFALIPPVRLHFSATTYPFIPYAWALQTEMMFYLTLFFIGIAAPFLYRLTKQPPYFWFAAAGTAGIMASVFAQLGWLPQKLAYGCYFAFGGALFFWRRGHRGALWVLLPAAAQMLWHFSGYAAEDFTVIAPNRAGQAALLAVILLALAKAAVTPIKNARLDRIFGELSYPLYLNHYGIGIFIVNTVTDFSTVTVACGIAASISLSIIMDRIVDKPLIKIRRLIRETS